MFLGFALIGHQASKHGTNHLKLIIMHVCLTPYKWNWQPRGKLQEKIRRKPTSENAYQTRRDERQNKTRKTTCQTAFQGGLWSRTHGERRKGGKREESIRKLRVYIHTFFPRFFCQRDGGVKILVRQPGPCFWLVKKNERRTGRKKIGSSFAGQIIET